MHVTEVKMFAGVVGSRELVGVHVDPSQCSTREEDGLPFESMEEPTVQQFVLAVQVTAVRYWPELAKPLFATTDQLFRPSVR